MPVARTLTLLLSFLFFCVANAQDAETSAQPAVLITGASSGIGKLTTEVLARSGTFVYAGARKQVDIDALNALDNVEAVRLDVTKDLEKACSLLEELLRSNGGKSRDHRMQETIIGTLADLFVKTANPQKAIEILEEFCGRDVEITAEGKQGALRLLAGLRRKHGLWSGS